MGEQTQPITQTQAQPSHHESIITEPPTTEPSVPPPEPPPLQNSTSSKIPFRPRKIRKVSSDSTPDNKNPDSKSPQITNKARNNKIIAVQQVRPPPPPRIIVRTLSAEGEVAIALRHLRSSDPILAQVIDVHQPPTFDSFHPPFLALSKSILYQQLAFKAGTSIYTRFVSLCGGESGVVPEAVLALNPQQLRQIGVSARKASYLHDLANKYRNGILSDSSIVEMDDKSLFTMLTMVKGIGSWSVHMFMIFSLHRPDVLPIGDLGVRKGVQLLYGLEQLPRPSQMDQLCEKWRPYRSVASWYMWRFAEAKGPPATAAAAASGTNQQLQQQQQQPQHQHQHQQQQQLQLIDPITSIANLGIEITFHYLIVTKARPPRPVFSKAINTVSSALSILPVAIELLFEDCVKACIRLIEALPWTEEEEQRVLDLIPLLTEEESQELLFRVSPVKIDSSDEMLLRLIQEVRVNANQKDFVCKMLRDFSCKGFPSRDSVRLAFDQEFDMALKVLKESLQSCSSETIWAEIVCSSERFGVETMADIGGYLSWLVERMIEFWIADTTTLDKWIDQEGSLTENLQKVCSDKIISTRHLVNVFGCTWMLADAVSTGHIVADRQVRMKLVKAWLPVALLFKDNARQLLPDVPELVPHEFEEPFFKIISTLPISESKELLLQCLGVSTHNVNDRPHLESAYKTWFRRAAIQPPKAN